MWQFLRMLATKDHKELKDNAVVLYAFYCGKNSDPWRCFAALYVQICEEMADSAPGGFREWGVKLVAGSFLGHDSFGLR
jgi:hypothetical protein